MARIWMPGGGGGADLDVTTAVAGDVLKDKVIVGPDGEPLTGTLELTGNAADSQVLAGKTYYNTDAKTKRAGIMVNHGAIMVSLNCGKSFTIPAGYHNGAGEVIANSLARQTDSTAVAGELLKDKTAYVKGNKITGTMANQGAKTASLNCGGSYTIPAGYHNGSGKVTANSLASQTDANAAAGDILKDKTAWVKGSKITGNMATMAGGTYTPSTSQQTVSCNGKKMTSDIIVKGDANLIAGNIIAGKSIFGVAGNARKYASFNKNNVATGSIVYVGGTVHNNFYPIVVTGFGFTPVAAKADPAGTWKCSAFLFGKNNYVNSYGDTWTGVLDGEMSYNSVKLYVTVSGTYNVVIYGYYDLGDKRVK